MELKKLAQWAKKTAHEKDVYRKVVIEWNDISGNEYDSVTLEKAFVVRYEQSFDGEKGEGEFYILLRSLDHMDDVFGQAWDSTAWNIDDVIVKAGDTTNVYLVSNPIATEYVFASNSTDVDKYKKSLEQKSLEQLYQLKETYKRLPYITSLEKRMLEDEIAKREKEKNSENKLSPGTGSIGLNGTALLIDYENLGESYKVYENGNLTAILSRDVEGKGNITYGYGILFKNTPEERKRLKDNYGLEFSEKISVSITLCEKMYQDYVNKNLAALHAFTKENDIWLNQNQLDALIMHRHLTYRLGKETQDILIEMFENTDANDPNLKNLYRDKLFEAMMNDLKSNVNEADYKKNENGWKNRIMDEIELFFDGDNIRNY